MMDTNIFKQLTKSQKEFIKYGMVGCSGLVIDLGICFLLVKVLRIVYPFADEVSSLFAYFGIHNSIDTSNLLISSIISSCIAVVNNFTWNSLFTFRVTDNKFKRFIPYATIAGVGMLVSTTLITIMVSYWGLPKMVAKAIAVCMVVVIQFFLNKFITFKKKYTLAD